MKQIHITRSNNIVTFETVSIDNTENVFFTNEDPKEAHWPTLTTNPLGPAPSPNSSQCTLPTTTPPFTYTYGCKIAGHENEKGIINVFAPLAAAETTALPPATVGIPISPAQVVVGGMSPYQISGQLFQITDSGGNIIQQGSGIGPGLQLVASTNNSGITVTGTPTQVGTYNFTFTVNDAMGRNLQQVQYSMNVS
jgi:Putative Ig domain